MVGQRPTVLVVDDDESNRALIEAFLDGVACRIVAAAEDSVALKAMDECAPDMVLLDVKMPGVDGLELCRRIKANPKWQLVPVVIITGLSSVTDRVDALEAGADDFMSNPIDRSELIARVRSMLHMRELHRQIDGAEQVVFVLAGAVEARDPFTGRHAHRVAEYAQHLGRCLELGEAEVGALYRGSIIHVHTFIRSRRKVAMGASQAENAVAKVSGYAGRKHFLGTKDSILVDAAERVLGVRFPPSYRVFLEALGAG